MKKPLIIAAALAATVPAGAAVQAAADLAPPEASIQFADRIGFQDFTPTDGQTVYMRLKTGPWYRASVTPGCLTGPDIVRLRYETNPDGSFDRRSSTLFVNGRPCPIESLVESGPPPAKVARGKN